uniref:Uncharacterized protein n=2 Tax=Caenorhabditis japonica TaxID=281687 RepID=A0A8R1EDN0_CAEJA
MVQHAQMTPFLFLPKQPGERTNSFSLSLCFHSQLTTTTTSPKFHCLLRSRSFIRFFYDGAMLRRKKTMAGLW